MITASPIRIRIARLVAIAADVVQLALFPFLVEGAVSPLDDVLDAVVSVVLIWLIGWHVAFLPSAVAKLVPFGDMAPTWTFAVFVATRDTPWRLPAGRNDHIHG